ncbi:signal peptide peptidase SppA [Candidatus Woesearchaeota archaeon]|nr:signal peptide peptidase SppA [Candidatus Woesearchaeota archaeon]
MAKKKVNSAKTLETIESFLRITRTLLGAIFKFILVIIFFVFLINLFMPSFKITMGNVALIPIKGTINTGPISSFTTEAAQSQKITDWIKEADEDDMIKAIVIEIDSPGGSPVASYEIADAIKKAKKPTIALIRERGASGGFWAATAADTIFANPMSITGSIGVIGSYVELAGLIERYNMTYRRFVSGENKDALSPFKEITPEQAQLFQKKIDKLHDYFITAVAQNRNLPKEQVIKDADGFIMLGADAKEKGYIDYLGGRDEVKEYLNTTLGIKEPEFKEYKAAPGFFSLLGASMNNFGYSIGKGISSNLETDFNLKV